MKKLQELYSSNKITLSELSKKTGFSISTISRYIKGQVKIINETYYDSIYKALSNTCSVEDNENKMDANNTNSCYSIDVENLKDQMSKNAFTNHSTYITPVQRPIRKGSVWYVKNNYATGSEQAFSRPCLVVSGDKLNSMLDVYTVVYLTSSEKSPLPNHISIKTSRDSIALCEQIFSVSRNRFVNYLTDVTSTEMEMVERGIMMTFGIPYKQQNINDSHDYLRLQVENRMLKEFNDNLMSILAK